MRVFLYCGLDLLTGDAEEREPCSAGDPLSICWFISSAQVGPFGPMGVDGAAGDVDDVSTGGGADADVGGVFGLVLRP